MYSNLSKIAFNPFSYGPQTLINEGVKIIFIEHLNSLILQGIIKSSQNTKKKANKTATGTKGRRHN